MYSFIRVKIKVKLSPLTSNKMKKNKERSTGTSIPITLPFLVSWCQRGALRSFAGAYFFPYSFWFFFFLMIGRPPRSALSSSSAASDVYKRQGPASRQRTQSAANAGYRSGRRNRPVSYTHLRAHETRHDLVCRLLLEKKKT